MDNLSYKIKTERDLELPEYIDVPEYVKNKSTCFGLLFLGWSFWIWMVLPLFTVFLWGIEGATIYQQLVLKKAPDSPVSILQMISLIAVSMFILISWASYNWIRFSRNERRKGLPPITQEKIAESFKVKELDIESMQRAKNIVLHYDEAGVLMKYEVIQAISKPA